MDRQEMKRQIQKLREKKASRSKHPPVPLPIEVDKGVVKVTSFSTKKTSLDNLSDASVSDNKMSRAAAKRRDSEIQRQAVKRSGGGCGGCKRKIGG